jgi:competence protein ComGC
MEGYMKRAMLLMILVAILFLAAPCLAQVPQQNPDEQKAALTKQIDQLSGAYQTKKADINRLIDELGQLQVQASVIAGQIQAIDAKKAEEAKKVEKPAEPKKK